MMCEFSLLRIWSKREDKIDNKNPSQFIFAPTIVLSLSIWNIYWFGFYFVNICCALGVLCGTSMQCNRTPNDPTVMFRWWTERERETDREREKEEGRNRDTERRRDVPHCIHFIHMLMLMHAVLCHTQTPAHIMRYGLAICASTVVRLTNQFSNRCERRDCSHFRFKRWIFICVSLVVFAHPKLNSTFDGWNH